jgi:uncharacterized protein (TIRG00374 family)
MRLSKASIQWFLRIAVAISLLYVLFRFVPFSKVVKVISEADGFWVTAGFVVVIFERLAAMSRITILTSHLRMPLSVWKNWEISTIATFYATFLPGDLAGGAVRWYRMSQPSGQRAQAFAALAIDRLLDTAVLIVFGIVFWLWDAPPFGTRLLDLAVVAILGGLVAAIVLLLNPKASELFATIVGWLPGNQVKNSLLERIEKVLSSARAFRQLSYAKMSLILVLSVLRQILSILILICFAEALAMSIGFSTIGWIRSFMKVITLLPIAFAGLGVREASFAILLEPYGIPAFQAVALSLFAFMTHLVVAVFGGVLELKNMFSSDSSRAVDEAAVPHDTTK